MTANAIELVGSRPISRTRDLPVGRGAWDAGVAEWQGSFLQAYGWGEVKARFGWSAARVAVPLPDGRSARAQILFRRLPVGTLAYVPRGPLGDSTDSTAAARLFRAVDQVARARGAFCLKVEPDQPSSPVLSSALARLGFRASEPIQPRSTLVVDLSHGVEEAWGRLSARARYNVRLATRRGVVVESGGTADVPEFCRLLATTSERAGFPVHESDYYVAVWQEFDRRGAARLLLARHEGQTVAASLSLRTGRRAYHLYAASASEGRQAKPSDLIQWEAIRAAAADGCVAYDLWGIPDEVGAAVESGQPVPADGEGGLWGVYGFKRGYGGEVVRYAGAFDLVYSASRYQLWRTLQPRLQRLAARTRRARILPQPGAS